MRALAPKGVDLILDCVAGSYAEENLEALALDGRWVLSPASCTSSYHPSTYY